MARVISSGRLKASGRIQLCDGQIMTLGEALDQGRMFVWKSVHASRSLTQDVREVTRYFAYEDDERCGGKGLSWDIGEKLYSSRFAKSGRDPKTKRMPRQDPAHVDFDRLRELASVGDWDGAIGVLAQAQMHAGWGLGWTDTKYAYNESPAISAGYRIVAEAWDVDDGAIQENIVEYASSVSNPRNLTSARKRRVLR